MGPYKAATQPGPLDALVGLFIFYAVALFVPATDGGYYFEVRNGAELVVNPFIWLMLLGLAILSGGWLALQRGVAGCELLFLGASAFFVTFNVVITMGGGKSDFNYLGLLLLASVAVFRTPGHVAGNAVAAAVLALGLASAFTILDGYFGLNVSPIVALKYVALDGTTEEIRVTNASLFGQSNAAGAALAFGLLTLLHHMTLDRRRIYSVVYMAGFLTLLSTLAAGPIAVVLIGMLTFALLSRRTSGWKHFLLPGAVAVVFVFVFLDLSAYLEYKGESGHVKYQRSLAFFDMVAAHPEMLLFGGNLYRSSDKFWTESSFLDLSLNFGLWGPLLTMLIVAAVAREALRVKDRFGAIALLLMSTLIVTQNSSLMPANIILLLVLVGRILGHSRRPSYPARS